MANARASAEIVYHTAALSTDAHAVAGDYSAESLENTVFRDSTRSRLGGVTDMGVQIEGYWETTQEAKLFPVLGGQHPVTLADSNTVGAVAYGMDTMKQTYEQGAAHGELFGFSLTFQSTSPIVRGQLALSVTDTASGNGTALQLGSASGLTVYAGLHVTAFNGTSLDALVQRDDNSGMTSPTTHITFTQATGLTSEWASVVGSGTDDWWRINYTFAGTSFTASAFIGLL